MRWGVVLLTVIAVVILSTPTVAANGCGGLLAALGRQLADTSCIESADLTTNNPATTPANDSLPGLPPFAFTPQTDRDVISPSPPNRTPITKAVPGIQLDARMSDDPIGEARILLRLPNRWNGKLVVATLAGLFAATASVTAFAGDKDAKAADKKVHCSGINSCSGKGACKSANNACSGKNGCAGKGWVEASEKECKDKGGKVVAEADKK